MDPMYWIPTQGEIISFKPKSHFWLELCNDKFKIYNLHSNLITFYDYSLFH